MSRLGQLLAVCAVLAGLIVPAAAQGASEPEPISLVSVALSAQDSLQRLEATGVDVTHDVSPTGAKVVLYSAADRAKLSAAGFTWTTLIRDLQAKNSAERAAEEQLLVPTALPSGRTTYRVYEDYVTELEALAAENPDFVRMVTIGQSVDGEDIIGLEIATDVNRADDGRPVYLQMGLHHAREWPSGEMPMEFAIDLVDGYNANDPRITALLDNVRTFVFPVINPDGFMVSRGAATCTVGTPTIIGGTGEYKRKNCRPANAAEAAIPCALRPMSGVDLNRNYGYYWGGGGASTDPTADNYRGTGPFSEPESEAVHQFVSDIHPTVFITNHTFTASGWWLRQPGFKAPFLLTGNVTPDETAMKDLGDDMGVATGWPSDLGWKLNNITGATEDWNYYAQGTYGYTPEARGSNFHAAYADMVVEEYEGDATHVGLGVREAFLIAGERAYDPTQHSIIQGSAPPGATLHLTKQFDSIRCQGGQSGQGADACTNPIPGVAESLETSLDVPATGSYSWHVNPSSRPLHPGETWTMTCERPGQGTFGPVQVSVDRGEAETVNWAGSCGVDQVNVPPTANFTVVPASPVAGEQVTFTSTSTDADGAIATTEWDLDDDGQFDDATGLVATTTFPAGTHDVAVKVTDDDGAADTETKSVVVSAMPPPNLPPVAGFTFFPPSPQVGDDVVFDSTSTDADGQVVLLEWDLDGDTQHDDAEGGQVTRRFTAPGTYPVSIRATDDDGASDTYARDVVIRATGTAPPSPKHSCLGEKATILGTPGPDRGASTVEGTAGDDVIVSMAGGDRVLGGRGDDLICTRRGADAARGGPGADSIIGGRGPDRLAGAAGNDLLRGNKGADLIRGGAGGDRCFGGRGSDRLRGCP